MKDYGSETQREEGLVAARWPHGFECPHCSHKLAYEFQRRELRYWQCKACRRQVSLRAGKMMENSKLPLTTCYLAIYLMTRSKTNIAALAMLRQLGTTWKAAWLMKHKLTEAMRQREENQLLQGDVRVDDAYLGGERTGGKARRYLLHHFPRQLHVHSRTRGRLRAALAIAQRSIAAHAAGAGATGHRHCQAIQDCRAGQTIQGSRDYPL